MRNLLVLSLALNLSLIMRVIFEGGKQGFFSVEEKQRGPSMAENKEEAHATQRALLSLSSSSGQDGVEKVINLDQYVYSIQYSVSFCSSIVLSIAGLH